MENTETKAAQVVREIEKSWSTRDNAPSMPYPNEVDILNKAYGKKFADYLFENGILKRDRLLLILQKRIQNEAKILSNHRFDTGPIQDVIAKLNQVRDDRSLLWTLDSEKFELIPLDRIEITSIPHLLVNHK